MEQQVSLKTPYKSKKEAEEQRVVDRFNELKSEPGAQTTAITLQLMREFEIHSATTVWSIRKRVAARAKQSKKK